MTNDLNDAYLNSTTTASKSASSDDSTATKVSTLEGTLHSTESSSWSCVRSPAVESILSFFGFSRRHDGVIGPKSRSCSPHRLLHEKDRTEKNGRFLDGLDERRNVKGGAVVVVDEEKDDDNVVVDADGDARSALGTVTVVEEEEVEENASTTTTARVGSMRFSDEETEVLRRTHDRLMGARRARAEGTFLSDLASCSARSIASDETGESGTDAETGSDVEAMTMNMMTTMKMKAEEDAAIERYLRRVRIVLRCTLSLDPNRPGHRSAAARAGAVGLAEKELSEWEAAAFLSNLDAAMERDFCGGESYGPLPLSSEEVEAQAAASLTSKTTTATTTDEERFVCAAAKWLGRKTNETSGRDVAKSDYGGDADGEAADLVFDCCRWPKDEDEEDGNGDGLVDVAEEPAAAAVTTTTTTTTCANGAASSHDDIADASDLVALCYRLAVAARALNPERCPYPDEERDDDDDDRLIDAAKTKADAERTIGPLGSPEPLVRSLLEHAAASARRGDMDDQKWPRPKRRQGGERGRDQSVAVTRAAFGEWRRSAFPHLASSLHAFVECLIFPVLPIPPPSLGATPSLEMRRERGNRARRCCPPIPDMPREDRSASAFFSSPNSPGLYALSSASRDALGGTWRRLFSTSTDGFSFHRLEHCVCGYSGPTLLVVRAYHPEDDGLSAIFGAYAHSPWKKSRDFYGSGKNFLFQLQPTVRIMRPKKAMGMSMGPRGRVGAAARGGKYQYLNPSVGVGKAAPALGTAGRHGVNVAGRGRTGASIAGAKAGGGGGAAAAHGLGFGGSVSRPRLFVSESMDRCQAHASDGTYEDGELFPSSSSATSSSSSASSYPLRPGEPLWLEVEALEVWAPGSSDAVASALADRERHRGVVQSNIDKARKVDRAAFLGDLRSGLIESKMFVHREQMRGREGGACLMEDDDA